MIISSFNIYNDYRKHEKNKNKEIVELINKYDIDIIGLQEVYPSLRKQLLNSIKERTYTGKFRYSFPGNILLRFLNEENPVITKYEVIDKKFYSMPFLPSTRMRMMTKIVIKYNNELVSIYSTHLEYKYMSVKKRQLDYIYNIISKDKNKIILLGDFNLKNNKEIFNNFCDKLKKLNINRVEFNHKTLKISKYKREIDHIFISDSFKLINKKVITNLNISDHYPVLIEVE